MGWYAGNEDNPDDVTSGLDYEFPEEDDSDEWGKDLPEDETELPPDPDNSVN